MYKRIIIGLLIILLSGSLAKPVGAATTTVKSSAKLTADKVLYHDETRKVEATGNVVITYNTTVIKADHALIDQDLNALLAEGKVSLTKDGDTFTGERLLYYFKNQQGLMSPANCQVTGPEVAEPLLLTAAEAFLKGDELQIKKSSVTGCDRHQPHYHFTAEQVEYFPEKRVVLYRVWYWEGRLRLLYFPKLSISLDAHENSFELPEIGYNDTEGWFLKWGYNYYFNDWSFGRVYLDKITERNGNGIGLTHYLKPSATSKWYQDYFYKDNSTLDYPKNDFRLGVGYENWTNDKLNYETNLLTRHRYTQTGDLEVENIADFYLKGSSPWPYLKLYFRDNDGQWQKYDQNGQPLEVVQDTFREMRFSNNWSYSLSKSLSLSTAAEWDKTEYLKQHNSTEQFKYSATVTKNWANSNLRLYYNDAQILSENYSTTNYLPELTYTISKLTLPLIKELSATFQYTNLEKIMVEEDETPKIDSGVRWAADLLKTNTLWQSKQAKWSLNLTSQYRYRHFEISLDDKTQKAQDAVIDEDQKIINGVSDLEALTENLSVRYNFTPHFSTSWGVGYTEKRGTGNNDFFSKGDYFLPGGAVTNSWAWSSQRLTANLSTEYSLYANAMQPVYFDMTWAPKPQQQVTLDTKYDWEAGLGQTDLGITYNPNENWNLSLNLGYNPQDAYWNQKEFRAFIKQRLSSKLHFEVNAVYDIFRDDFGVATVALDYDWHCRDLKFYYDHLEKEYWVLISFKAFPQASFKLSSDPDDYYDWYLN